MAKEQITHDELKDQLQAGIIKFFFQKIGGDLREAYGTTNLDDIPFDKHPKGIGKPKSSVAFFDVQKQEWRSVSRTSLIWK